MLVRALPVPARNVVGGSKYNLHDLYLFGADTHSPWLTTWGT